MTFSSMTTNIMVKIVLDTNTILSGTVFGGMVEVVIDLIIENKLQLFISQHLIKEVLEKLNKFKASEASISKTMTVLETGELVTPSIKITVCRDPEDNFVLELAQTCNADYLIIRDKDLLDLPNQKWKKTKIVKSEDFLPLVRKMGLLK